MCCRSADGSEAGPVFGAVATGSTDIRHKGRWSLSGSGENSDDIFVAGQRFVAFKCFTVLGIFLFGRRRLRGAEEFHKGLMVDE